ncbi:hypothetical protein KIW84_033652 [Lathyrus oleraceus]|uniref:Uncharacterized protein n=1 Tax=Pisum sativum TaxID=3888 RepID=A0A9D5B3E9_PEA|nr:hypothetical protein KIW84_033652 [Pisum sativum]
MEKLPETFSKMFIREDDIKSPVLVNVGSPPSSANIPTINSSVRLSVSATAKTFKDQYFPSDPGAVEVGVTDDLLHLRNLCMKLNADVDDQRTNSKGKSKTSGFGLEECLTGVISEVIRELGKGDGVSTFEFIGSGVVLQNALSSMECFPVLLSQSPKSSSGSARLSSGLSALSHPFKLRLCRAQGEKSLRDYSGNVVLIDPLASLAAIEEFLWPRIQRSEPVQKKVTAKPKPVDVIDIIISEEESSKEMSVHNEKGGEVNSRKKSSRTITFVLKARSRASCGLTNEPKEIVPWMGSLTFRSS